MKIDCNYLREKAEKHKTDIGFEFLATQVQNGKTLINEAVNECGIQAEDFIKLMYKYDYYVPIYILRGREIIIDERCPMGVLRSLMGRLLLAIQARDKLYFSNPRLSISDDAYLFSIEAGSIQESLREQQLTGYSAQKVTLRWSSSELHGGFCEGTQHHLIPITPHEYMFDAGKIMGKSWNIPSAEQKW